MKFIPVLLFFFLGAGTAVRAQDTCMDNRWSIDMTPVVIDGKYYAVWSGWEDYFEETEAPEQNLYIAELHFHDRRPYVTLGRRALLSVPEKEWELKRNEKISLLEGPQALYHDGDVFIVYSTRGSWTPYYKMGLLEYRHGRNPLDPSSWVKSGSPVFALDPPRSGTSTVSYGAGHASFVKSPDGTQDWICYHSKTSLKPGWGDRKVFLSEFVFGNDGLPVFKAASSQSDRPSGETGPEEWDTGMPVKFSNPIYAGADPWIILENGKYYTCRADGRGIRVTESSYMTESEGPDAVSRIVWTLHDPDSGKWNIRQLWAPELHHIGGKWYIFYTAGRQAKAPFWEQRSGVLVSEDGPFGPYAEHDENPLFTGD